MRSLISAFALVITLPAHAEYSVWDYGRECKEALGVGVPSFSCLDENASRFPLTVNGRAVAEGEAPPATCDNPARVYPCMPGERLLKFVDYIRRGGRTEKIVTIAHCRRRERVAAGSPRFEVAMIQHNETNNKTCWFDSGSTSKNAAPIPPPYQEGVARNANGAADAFWEPPSNILTCTSCHTSSVWLRSPYISAAERSGRTYVRREGQARYEATDQTNSIPDYGRRGPGCNVGRGPFVAFNRQAKQLRIDGTAYAARFGAAPPNTAPVTTCTRCHYIGTGYTCDMSREAHGSVAREKATGSGGSFPTSHWMPPRDSWPSHLLEQIDEANDAPDSEMRDKSMELARRGFQTYFGPAMKALQYCCKNPEATANVDGRAVKICRSRFTQTVAADVDDPCAPTAPGGRPAAAPTH